MQRRGMSSRILLAGAMLALLAIAEAEIRAEIPWQRAEPPGVAGMPWTGQEAATQGDLSVTNLSPPGSVGWQDSEVPWQGNEFGYGNPAGPACQDPDCSPCPEFWWGCGGPWRRPCCASLAPPPSPFLFFQADALLLARNIKSETFAFSLPRFDPVLGTNDFYLPLQGGVRLLGGVRLGEFYRIEGLYFGPHRWHDAAALRDQAANLFVPFDNAGAGDVVGGNNLVEMNLSSRLNNAEVNLRYLVPEPLYCLSVSLLAGARYTQLDERFGLFGVQDGVVPPTSAFDVRTKNEMYGAQLGAQAYLPVWQRCWIDFEIKGALMQNNATQQTLYTNSVGAEFFSQARQKGAAFVGELDLSLMFQPSRFMSFSGGYMLVWLEGVALAPDNLNRDLAVLRLGPPHVDRNGNVPFHGPHAGMTLSW